MGSVSVASCRCCVCVLCASCGSSQCCVLQDLQCILLSEVWSMYIKCINAPIMYNVCYRHIQDSRIHQVQSYHTTQDMTFGLAFQSQEMNQKVLYNDLACHSTGTNNELNWVQHLIISSSYISHNVPMRFTYPWLLSQYHSYNLSQL